MRKKFPNNWPVAKLIKSYIIAMIYNTDFLKGYFFNVDIADIVSSDMFCYTIKDLTNCLKLKAKNGSNLEYFV